MTRHYFPAECEACLCDEIDRLRAELAVKDEVALGIMAALVERNDAIARVRELCFAIDGREVVTVVGILAALDGDTEVAPHSHGE